MFFRVLFLDTDVVDNVINVCLPYAVADVLVDADVIFPAVAVAVADVFVFVRLD